MRVRRAFWVWLLPVFLLLAQQGQYRHELGHDQKHRSTSQKQAAPESEPCALCAAFAQLSGAARPEPPPAMLLAGLRFHCVAEPAHIDAEPALPAARNRGPPIA